MAGVRKELREKRHHPQPVRRVMIPKLEKGSAPLSTQAERTGRRDPERYISFCATAAPTWSMADLFKHFDTIPHCELMQCVADESEVRRCCVSRCGSRLLSKRDEKGKPDGSKRARPV